MNNLVKMSVSALFALFLTACDKPATSTENKEAQQPTASAAQPQPETVNAEPAKPVDTGAEDYKTLREWQDTQEKQLNDAIRNTNANLTEQQKNDPALMQEMVNKALLAQIDSIKASAETLNIQNAEVKALKDKTIEVLALGAEMIVEGAKMEKNPTPEAHKAFGELQTKLNQLAEEGQQLENALRAKYAPEPATVPTPEAPTAAPVAPQQ